MPFQITHEPLTHINGAKPITYEKPTAKDAWRSVDAAMRSDEKVTSIIHPDGYRIGWQELQRLAEEE
ncbi:hypothetical protein PH552_12285 [Rhizobium sp. CNPSo 3968]|uniref:hypothetical protein n=1 Tax=Rhizobium sp. CNPSo 3968 TaxID=3021408 RepID=UPI00254D049C|nr:hypothetical protein [Rhizobium sp. CNPSo 3968]MDK4720122.1 hypothetical protein [Rhizobium sp. CNPSo 3968]